MTSIKEKKFIYGLSDFLGILFVTIFVLSSYAHFKIDNIFFTVIYFIMITYYLIAGISLSYWLSMLETYNKEKRDFMISSVIRNSRLNFNFFFYYVLLIIGFLMPFFFNSMVEKVITSFLLINFVYQAKLHYSIYKKYKI